MFDFIFFQFLLGVSYALINSFIREKLLSLVVGDSPSHHSFYLKLFFLNQATVDHKADLGNPKSWPQFILRADRHMCNYLTSGKRTKLAVLSSSLRVWILLKVWDLYYFLWIRTSNAKLICIISVLFGSIQLHTFEFSYVHPFQILCINSFMEQRVHFLSNTWCAA